ncbi:MAG: hypothetical protein CTY36_03870, partial [Methylocystis sp.]
MLLIDGGRRAERWLLIAGRLKQLAFVLAVVASSFGPVRLVRTASIWSNRFKNASTASASALRMPGRNSIKSGAAEALSLSKLMTALPA